MNYKAPLIQALDDAGFRTKEYGSYARTTFTHLRKDGTRRVKLWFANDIWLADHAWQVKLERMLKANYGEAYLGGYFIVGARAGAFGDKSFCVILDQSKLAS